MDKQKPFSFRLEERWIPPKEWKREDWNEFVTEHSRIIFGVCKQILHDEQHAEDVMQETFIKLFNNADKFRHGGYDQFIAWAARTAKRKSLNLLRQLKAMRKLEQNYCAEYEVRYSLLTPLDLIIGNKIDFSRVQIQIPEIVRLKHIEGFTHREIAKRLGITEKSAKSMLSIAMKELKESALKI